MSASTGSVGEDLGAKVMEGVVKGSGLLCVCAWHIFMLRYIEALYL